jgi:hypothetical protein
MEIVSNTEKLQQIGQEAGIEPDTDQDAASAKEGSNE